MGAESQKLILKRWSRSPVATLGSVDGHGFSCFSLEPTRLMIPAGVYSVKLTDSGRASRGELWTPDPTGKRLPEILHVPGREGIRIHAGNSATDSVGCVLVGTDLQGTTLLGSRRALTALYEWLVRYEAAHVSLEIVEV